MPIRPATLEDAKQIAVVYVKSWQAAYRGLLPDNFLDNLSVKQRTAYWQSVLSDRTKALPIYEEDSHIVGFVDCGHCRDEEIDQNRVGEIYASYLLPDAWGKGYGAALFNEALTILRQQNYEIVSLWVLGGNQRAIRFYQRCGLRPDGVTRVETQPAGIELHEVHYTRNI